MFFLYNQLHVNSDLPYVLSLSTTVDDNTMLIVRCNGVNLVEKVDYHISGNQLFLNKPQKGSYDVLVTADYNADEIRMKSLTEITKDIIKDPNMYVFIMNKMERSFPNSVLKEFEEAYNLGTL